MLGQWEAVAAEVPNEKLMWVWQAGQLPDLEHPLSSLSLNPGCLRGLPPSPRWKFPQRRLIASLTASTCHAKAWGSTAVKQCNNCLPGPRGTYLITQTSLC